MKKKPQVPYSDCNSSSWMVGTRNILVLHASLLDFEM